MSCIALINGGRYVIEEDLHTAQQRIDMVIQGHSARLSIAVEETDHTVYLHLMPHSISTYALYEVRD